MLPKPLNVLRQEELSDFFSSIDTVVTDCDEVLWIGSDPITGSLEMMDRFKQKGKRTFYVTNNSTCTRPTLVKKFSNFGYNVQLEEIINTAYMAALYIKSLKLDINTKVFVIGSQALKEELDAAGVKNFGVGRNDLTKDVLSFISSMKIDPTVGVVLIGFDQFFSVPKIVNALTYLRNPNVKFVATNPDTRAKYEFLVIPGTGSMVQAIITGSGREPIYVGKPETFMCETIVQKWKLIPEKTLMVGDSCYTDILLGRRCGFHTLLVLTGSTTLRDLTKWSEIPEKEYLIPEFFTNRLGDLLKWF